MKNLFLTLVFAVASVAAFAQTSSLFVNNTTNSAIFVRADVINTNNCLTVGQQSVWVQPRTVGVLPPIAPNANYEWAGISATAFPTGEGVSSTNPCNTSCLSSANSSSGLNANWPPSLNCNLVTIFW